MYTEGQTDRESEMHNATPMKRATTTSRVYLLTARSILLPGSDHIMSLLESYLFLLVFGALRPTLENETVNKNHFKHTSCYVD